MRHTDAIIIGAGRGLRRKPLLDDLGIDHVVLERGRSPSAGAASDGIRSAS
jgi:hypothetical protein